MPDSPPRSSQLVLNISGIHVYLYGVSELTPEQAADAAVVFHIHGRTRTYKDAENVAHKVLHDIRQRAQIPTRKGIVMVTFDNRNHGLRMIDETGNQDWKQGNTRHAQDMLSVIDGIVADVQTVIKFLPSYVYGQFTPTDFIATGVSLGGHVTWNLLADPSTKITRGIPIIGSPDLSALMLDRLGKYTDASQVPPETPEWNPLISELYRERDAHVADIANKEILILNGAVDPLVPSRFTRPWLNRSAPKNQVTFYEQEGVGHTLSPKMIEMMVDWLVVRLL